MPFRKVAVNKNGIMKRSSKTKVLLLASAAIAGSCSLFSYNGDSTPDDRQSDKGKLCLSFNMEEVRSTRAKKESIDTNNFILKVSDKNGKTIYEGAYGDSPEKFELAAGSYTVRAVSEEFSAPAFSRPQYGDEQCVVVPPGKEIGVRLSCVMMNCGVKLRISSDFLTSYPKSFIFVKSDGGRMLYSYTEKRTAYFKPGRISIILSDDESSETLMNRSLAAGDVLDVKVNVAKENSPDKGAGINIQVDTSKNRINDVITIGGGSGGSSSGGNNDEVLTIPQAKERIGEEVWVSGYIVGGDLTSTNASFEAPFKSASNLLLGPRSSASSRTSCLSVQLTAGDVRNALNLVSNPEMLGKSVELYGEVDPSYYGMTGLKNVSDYRIK